MKHRVGLSLFVLLCLFPISMAFSNPDLDDLGNPNDPSINERANACYGGGAMEGKCDSEWAWNCGWYLIRYDAGLIARGAVPAECTSLLSAAPAVSTPGAPTLIGPTSTPTSTPLPTFTSAGCVLHFNGSSITNTPDVYVNFNGGYFLAPQVNLYFDNPDCSGAPDTTSGLPIAYAPNGDAEATAICNYNGYSWASKHQVSGASVTYICNL